MELCDVLNNRVGRRREKGLRPPDGKDPKPEMIEAR